jgi:integrase
MWRSLWAQYINSIEAGVNGCPQKRWYHKTKAWIESHPEEFKSYLKLKQKNQSAAEALRLAEWKSVTIRPHDLHHSYCTMLRDAGVDPKLAIRWMGHADEKMILRVYDHPSAFRERTAIDNLNKRAFQVQNEVQNKKASAVSNENP